MKSDTWDKGLGAPAGRQARAHDSLVVRCIYCTMRTRISACGRKSTGPAAFPGSPCNSCTPEPAAGPSARQMKNFTPARRHRFQRSERLRREEGLWIGRIQLLEEFLELPPPSGESLAALSLEELKALQERLHREHDLRFKQR